MGMFTKYGSYTKSAAINDADIIAQECFEDNMHTAALRVVAESESNWNQIMQAMAIQELAAYEETGDADYYLTESTNGFFASVKAFFKKLLEKIKGIFVKFVSIIDSWAKSDKDFVNKYKKKVLSANTKDFEFNGYVFTYKRENPGKGDNYFVDVYKFVYDFDESDIHMQETETDGYKLATIDEIKKYADEGIFLHYDSIKQVFV